MCYAELMAALSAGMAMHNKVEYLHHETVYVSAQRDDAGMSRILTLDDR